MSGSAHNDAISIEPRPIIYKTPPMPVLMSDCWYELANPEHFWVRRRFEVMQRLAAPIIQQARKLAEVGCGNGLVQRYMEDQYKVQVSGFELNELALKQTVSRTSPLICYDIHQRDTDLKGAFDLVLLFDVLEHITDEKGFLESIKYHMATGGRLIINVPAHQALFSGYDRAVGHVRRYSSDSLATVANAMGFRVVSYTYWGAPLIPLLLMRKALMAVRRQSEQEIVSTGFDPGPLNAALMLLARCEIVPQHMVGTSLMAVLERQN